MTACLRALALLTALLASLPAAAERVIAGLSADVVPITSNFTGTSLALFGVIGPDAQTAVRRGAYDAIVVVRGPARSQTVWRKERVAFIWVNGESRTYVAAPVYFATLSNRALTEVALDPVRSEAQLGLDGLRLTQRWERGDPVDDRLFRQAFLELRNDEGVYFEDPDNIRFLAPNVFRARIELPANVPIGFYTIEVLVLSDGFIVGRETASFRVEKVGFEAAVFSASRNQPVVYGIATIVLAIGTGWAAGILFRRG